MFDCSADMRNSMYSRARNRAWRGQVRSALTGRSCRLFTLAEIDATCTVHARRPAGIRTVPIGQIRGSQDRSHDFDRDFNPLQDHSKGRWLGIAAARQQGKALPPVELVQVGDVYFVQDGHHRISVAQALGQRDIDAKVMVWQVTGPLPWEESAAAHSLTGQETGIGRLTNKVRDNSARLEEHFLLSLRNLLAAAGVKSRAQVVP
jgi:hypothetical protein